MANPLYGQNKFDNEIDIAGRYLDFCGGYEGNLLATGVTVSEAEAVAALAAVSSADQGDSYAGTLIANARNSSAQTGAAAGTIHLPTATKGVHLVLDYADVVDGSTGAQTIAVNGGAAASTGSTLIASGLLAKQAIGVGTGIAGNSVETARTNAEWYSRRFIDFMSFNQTTYPEYTSNINDDIYPSNDATFNGWVL